MSCSHEAGEHDHHNHGHHNHDHEHDLPPDQRGLQSSLYRIIDFDNVRCLNEAVPGSAVNILKKQWHERKNMEPVLESDCDDQLIIYVPFTGNVKLKSIALKGGPGEETPANLKVFINREDLDFDNIDHHQATQEWELVLDSNDVIEYTTKISRFSGVRNLTIFITGSVGGDISRLSYLGFFGEWNELIKDPIITVYELSANPADHKNVVSDLTRQTHYAQ